MQNQKVYLNKKKNFKKKEKNLKRKIKNLDSFNFIIKKFKLKIF